MSPTVGAVLMRLPGGIIGVSSVPGSRLSTEVPNKEEAFRLIVAFSRSSTSLSIANLMRASVPLIWMSCTLPTGTPARYTLERVERPVASEKIASKGLLLKVLIPSEERTT
jgi:hypothetical protein